MVYRATNDALNRVYALKVLAPELADDVLFRDRFKREIRVAASLNHSNVVGIHYAGEHEGMLFLAMDLIDGTDLRDLIIRAGRLDPDRAVALLAQITSALDAAHAKGLVHRDVKPANVLISVKDGEEHAYLTDFGLAKRFDNATALTVKGDVVGTVHYMPPEQITGNRTDARSDIYALGCVLFQMLTGKVPYEREHSVATLFAHVYEPPPALEGPIAASHPTLGPVIAKAMAKDPTERYLSAGDLARDAFAALEGARYTGATIVATGEARPVDEGPASAAAERTQAALSALQAAMDEPPAETATPPAGSGGATRASTQVPPPASPTVASWLEEADAAADAPAGAAEPANIPPTRSDETRRASAAAIPPAPVSAAATVAAGAPPADPGPKHPSGASFLRRRRLPLAALALLIVAAVAAVVIVGSGSKKSTPPPLAGTPFATVLAKVPDNRVTASGMATVTLRNHVATVTISAQGLLSGAPHAMHIHAGGRGRCPPASAGRLHNGHLSISTTDGIIYYGPAVVSLTTVGDTSPRSIIDFTRYPSASDIRYTRRINVSAKVAAEIRSGNAVVVIHGIDYNGNGIYDNVLDRSDLSNALTGESTAPALCGELTAAKQTTGGSSADGGPTTYSASLDVHMVTMHGASVFYCSPTITPITVSTAAAARRPTGA